ncbi:hypothetical protein [Nitrospira sp. Nam74]
MGNIHNGHIEEVRRFLKKAFHLKEVSHATEINTDFAFEYDGTPRRITVARAFFDSLTKGDIIGILECWKLAEKVVTAAGTTVYVGEDGISILE